MRSALTAFLVIISSVPALADPLRCEIAQKFSCSSAGCATGQIGIFNVIDVESGKFSRCDTKGCDDYSANFTRSGVYINVDVPGREMVAKLSVDGSQFVEVATLMNVVLVSFGACKPQ